METISIRDLMAYDVLDDAYDYDGDKWDASEWDAIDAESDETIIAWVIAGEL